MTLSTSGAAVAREARGLCEETLAIAGWPWRLGLSRWIDALIIVEEQR